MADRWANPTPDSTGIPTFVCHHTNVHMPVLTSAGKKEEKKQKRAAWPERSWLWKTVLWWSWMRKCIQILHVHCTLLLTPTYSSKVRVLSPVHTSCECKWKRIRRELDDTTLFSRWIFRKSWAQFNYCESFVAYIKSDVNIGIGFAFAGSMNRALLGNYIPPKHDMKNIQTLMNTATAVMYTCTTLYIEGLISNNAI